MDVTVDIKVCTRCGKAHERLPMKEFSNKPPRYTHFGDCPETHEPLLAIVSDNMTEFRRL